LPQEVTTLVKAKRDKFIEELDIVNNQDLMNPDANKWVRINIEVMRAGYSPCMRDGPTCKTKWNQLIPNYKRIADFFTRTSINGLDYWDMSAIE